jgi:thiamine pyrophosphate-dependent acetolactate synthase large subunit-like protein
MEGDALPLRKGEAVAYTEALVLGVSNALDEEEGVEEEDTEPLADWLPDSEGELPGVSDSEGAQLTEANDETLACVEALTLRVLSTLPEKDAIEEADPEFMVLPETE